MLNPDLLETNREGYQRTPAPAKPAAAVHDAVHAGGATHNDLDNSQDNNQQLWSSG